MPSKALATFESAVTLTISLASLGNGAGRISDVIDNSTTRAPAGFLFVRVRTGGSAPTNNTPIKFYLIRRSDAATDLADGALGTSDAAVSAEPTNAECVGSIVVGTGTNTTYEKSIPLYDLPKKFSIVVWNAIGQALNSTGGDHVLQFVPVTMEAQ